MRQDIEHLRQSESVHVDHAECQRRDRYGEDFRDDGTAFVCEYEAEYCLFHYWPQYGRRDDEDHRRDLLRRCLYVALVHGLLPIRVQQSVRDYQDIVYHLGQHERPQYPEHVLYRVLLPGPARFFEFGYGYGKGRRAENDVHHCLEDCGVKYSRKYK